MTHMIPVPNRHRKSMVASFMILLVTGLMAAGMSVMADKPKPQSSGKPSARAGRPDRLAHLFPGAVTSLKSTTMNSLSLLPAGTINVNSFAQSPGASGDCTLGEAIQGGEHELAG